MHFVYLGKTVRFCFCLPEQVPTERNSAMPLQWTVPVPKGRGQAGPPRISGQRCGNISTGTPRPGSGNKSMNNRAASFRQSTSSSFSTSWHYVGSLSPMDKIESLHRCDGRFAPEFIMQYMEQEDALDSFVFHATGWQPGHPLALICGTRDREDYFKKFGNAHMDRGYPLRSTTAEQILESVRESLGFAPCLAFCLDIDKRGNYFLSNGVISKPITVAVSPGSADRGWSLKAPGPDQGPEFTVVTDGLQSFYCVNFFTQEEHDSAMKADGKQPVDEEETPIPQGLPTFAAAPQYTPGALAIGLPAFGLQPQFVPCSSSPPSVQPAFASPVQIVPAPAPAQASPLSLSAVAASPSPLPGNPSTPISAQMPFSPATSVCESQSPKSVANSPQSSYPGLVVAQPQEGPSESAAGAALQASRRASVHSAPVVEVKVFFKDLASCDHGLSAVTRK